MPIHDWSRVDAGIFHDFHHEWLLQIKHALNGGLLPRDYYALAEQIAGDYVPDVITLQHPSTDDRRQPTRRRSKSGSGGVATQTAPPKAGIYSKKIPRWFAEHRKNSIAIRHVSRHNVVAVLEIVSPGNKSGTEAIKAFVKKSRMLLAAGIHLTIVDVFPPTRRDPKGVHPIVWGASAREFRFDASRPLTCVAYVAGDEPRAVVETASVGGKLPDTPIYLTPTEFVLAPLEKTYRAAYKEVPEFYRDILEGRSEWPRRGPV